MDKLYKLKKDDVKMLEKAGFSKGALQKGDYVVCVLNGKIPTIKLFADEETRAFSIRSYRPLENDQIAFAFLGDKYYYLKDAGKQIWNDYAKEVSKASAELVLEGSCLKSKKLKELRPAFYTDGRIHEFEGEDDAFLPKNVTLDEHLASAADLTCFGKYTDEIQEYALKSDKIAKKLSKITDAVYKTAEKEMTKEDPEEEMEDDFDR